MIIDLILDRENGKPYVPANFYRSVAEYDEAFQEIVRPILSALDGGEEEDVKRVLCDYVDEHDYNMALYSYCVVLRTGPKNIIYRTPNGFNLTAAYAEILEIVKAEETIKTTHPFKVGEEFTVSTLRAGAWVPDTWEIIKATNATVTLKNHATGKTVNRKPRIGWTSSGEKWKISVGEYSTDICKDIEEK